MKRFWVEKGVFKVGHALERTAWNQSSKAMYAARVAQACWGRPQGLDPGVKERLQGTLG